MHKKIFAIMSIQRKQYYVLMINEQIPLLIPEIKKTYCCDGGPNHAETVFKHLVETSSYIRPCFPLLRFAALLHDIGKPDTYKNGMFRGHAKKSAEIAVKIMCRLGGFNEKEKDFVTTIISAHMMPPFERMRESRIADKFKKLQEHGVSVNDFLRLRLADRHGNMLRRKKYGHLPFSTEYPRYMIESIRTALEHSKVKSHNPLAVTGKDVMEILGIQQGPQVGEVLRAIAETCPHDDRQVLLDAIRQYSLKNSMKM